MKVIVNCPYCGYLSKHFLEIKKYNMKHEIKCATCKFKYIIQTETTAKLFKKGSFSFYVIQQEEN